MGTRLSYAVEGLTVLKMQVEEQERLFLAALDCADSGAILTPVDSELEGPQIVCINAALSLMMGYTPEELSGQPVWRLFCSSAENFSLPPDLLGGSQHAVSFEALCCRRDGSSFPAECLVSPIRSKNGQITYHLWLMFDATSQHREREKLLQQGEVLRQIVENVPAVLWMTNADLSEILYVNPAFEHVWGRDRGVVIDAPGFPARFIHPEDRERVRNKWQDRLDGKISQYEDEYRLLWPEGAVEWMHVRVAPVYDTGGQLYRLVGMAENVTERVGAEQNLRDSEAILKVRVRQQAAVADLGQYALKGIDLLQLMQRAVEMVSDALEVEFSKVLEFLPDGETLILRAGIGWKPGYVGRATLAVSENVQAGYTLLSRTPLIVEDYCHDPRFVGPTMLHDHHVAGSLSVVIPGLERPFGVLGAHTTKRRHFTQDDIHFLESIANVLAMAVERHRTEVSLLHTLAKTKDLYEVGSHIGMVRTADDVLTALRESIYLQTADRVSLLIFDTPWSQTPPKCCGVLAEWQRDPAALSMAGGRYNLSHFLSLRDLSRDEPSFIEDVTTDSRLEPAIRDLLVRLGSRSIALFPLIAGGDWYGMLAFHSRESGRWNSAECHHIQGLVDQAAVAIDNIRLLEAEAIARRNAEEADKLKLKFLAMVSHELRTPLTSIKGFATTLLADDVTWDAERQREFIEIINDESDRLTELIEQLLDLSQLEAGTLRIMQEHRYLKDIVGVTRAKLDAFAAQHRLVIDIPPDLPPIFADGQRIGQVLSNLVDNAAKYSPPGTTITVSARTRYDYLQIDVSDEGPGIPDAERQYVFEAFHRSVKSERSGIKGSGLGLAICRGLIEAHGGDIWVQERNAPGAVLSFTLPLIRG